jgi:uncharacterized protein with HEPN domain
MPYRDWTFRIADILDAITAVQKYTEGMGFADFVSDRKTVDAVIRNFIIIGEAACNIPEEICQAHTEIPWQDMRAMRHFIVHEYFGVSDKIIWDTIQKDIPSLVPFLKQLSLQT